MFNLQGSEIIFILLLALVVLGPEKLPGAIRRFTRTYAELRKMGNSFQEEVKSAFDEPMREVRETADLIKKQVDIDALESESDASRALDESAAAEREGGADAAAADEPPADPEGDGGAVSLPPPDAPAGLPDPAPDETDRAVAVDPAETDLPPAAPPRPTVPPPPPPFAASHPVASDEPSADGAEEESS